MNSYGRSYFAGIVIGLILLAGVFSGFVSLGPTVVETTVVTFRAENFTAAGVEAVIDLTASRNFVDAGKAATTQPVPVGRLLVLRTLCVMAKNAGAATQSVVVALRVNPTGAAVANSPMVALVGVSTPSAVAGATNALCVQLGDGVELSGNNQLAITQVGSVLAGFSVVATGYERAL